MGQGVCQCGRGLPLIGELQGRVTDFVVAKDGTVMYGLALIYVVRDLPGIAKFKIVQESMDHTQVLLVAGPGFCGDGAKRVRAGKNERLRGGVRNEGENVVDLSLTRI